MLIVDRLVPRDAFHMSGDASLPREVVDFVAQSRKPTVFTIDYDGKTVTCKGGTITVASKTTAGGVRPGQLDPVLTQSNPGQPPRKAPVLSQNVGVFAQTP